MNAFEAFLSKHLQERRAHGLFRTLKTVDPRFTDFSSNDYLGLARSEQLSRDIAQAVRSSAAGNGSTGSRLLTGNSIYAEETEAFLASVFKAESALVFNSGYAANLAVLSSIPQKNDTIIYDELAHASIKDGARLSLAKRFSFRHNDLGDLTKKVSRATGNVYVVVESIYSMDGDEAPIRELAKFANDHGVFIVLDEAHSTGVYGERGGGLALKYGVADDIAIRIHTFGKAMGVHGACVAGTESLRHYLTNFARPFIYTTAPDLHSLASIKCSFQYLEENIALQTQLEVVVNKFLNEVNVLPNRTNSRSAIQTFIVEGAEAVKQIASELQAAELDVRPILSPTVPKGRERLRICLHAFNTTEEILRLTTRLNSYASTRKA